jgi:hypothetical protein
MPDATGLVSWSDVRAAEKLLEEAVARRAALSEPDNWQANESLDPEGRRHIHFAAAQFELLEHADEAVKRARSRVIATRRAWVGLTEGGGI